MKSVLVLVLMIQVATLAVLGGQMLRPDPDERVRDLEREFVLLRDAIGGTVNHQREVLNYIEQVRQDLQQMSAGGGAVSVSDIETEAPQQKAPVPINVFPETKEVLLELRDNFRQMQSERNKENNFLEPFLMKQKTLSEKFLDRGPEALHWTNVELSRPPFDSEREPDFQVFLLREILPALATVDQAAAFKTARSALLDNAGISKVRFAAAICLREIDSKAWVREVIPVVQITGSKALDLKIQLLEMFVQDPHPQAYKLCEDFLLGRQFPEPLRIKSLHVIAKQDSGPVDSLLRKVLFEDPDNLLKVHAIQALHERLGNSEEMRVVLGDVLKTDPAKISPTVQEKAQRILDEM